MADEAAARTIDGFLQTIPKVRFTITVFLFNGGPKVAYIIPFSILNLQQTCGVGD